MKRRACEWLTKLCVALLFGGLFAGSCTVNTLRRVADELDSAADDLDPDADDIDLGDWLEDELDDL